MTGQIISSQPLGPLYDLDGETVSDILVTGDTDLDLEVNMNSLKKVTPPSAQIEKVKQTTIMNFWKRATMEEKEEHDQCSFQELKEMSEVCMAEEAHQAQCQKAHLKMMNCKYQ